MFRLNIFQILIAFSTKIIRFTVTLSVFWIKFRIIFQDSSVNWFFQLILSQYIKCNNSIIILYKFISNSLKHIICRFIDKNFAFWAEHELMRGHTLCTLKILFFYNVLNFILTHYYVKHWILEQIFNWFLTVKQLFFLSWELIV